MTIGAEPCRFSSFLSSFNAAAFASRLDHDVEHFAFAVDRPPHIHAPAYDRDDHLIDVPFTVWCRSPAPKVARYSQSKLQHPSPDSLVSDVQIALRQQILDITIAQGEAQVEPDRVPDHNWRKAVAARNRLHGSA
jgi:hypothetical protein